MAGPGGGWWLRMAWRDSRRHRGSLICFVFAIVAGVAALVAVNSFSRNLERAIDRRANALLGADLKFSSTRPFDARAEALIAELGGAQSRQTRFASMAYFPEQRQSRLVAVRGLEGGFPYYGELETDPAGVRVQDRDDPVAIVDAGLMAQFGLEVGDPIEIGEVTFRIEARLLKIPGGTAIEGIFSPRLYIPHRFVEETNLIRVGSIAYYNVLFRFEDGLTPAIEERLKAERDAWMRDSHLGYETVESRKAQAGEILSNLNRFLSLVGFVALLLGAIGIAGAIQLYLRQKVDTIAVLRCLGARGRDAFAIFLLQVGLLGAVGSLFGGAIGVGIQQLLPVVMGPFLPIEDIEVFIAWPVLLTGMGFGWSFTFLFTLAPLLPVRRVPPLRALRAAVERKRPFWRDPALVGVWLLVGGITLGFALWQSRERPLFGLAFMGGLLVALGLLAGLSALLRWGLRRTTLRGFPFAWRQGLANLYRPQNRTLFLMTTLGMGVFLLLSLYLTERSLLNEGEFDRSGAGPNLLLFDIQPDQTEDILNLLEAKGHPVLAHAPVVTMNLSSLNGETISELRERDEAGEIKIERWALFQEYRTTYREAPDEGVRLREGTFTPVHSLDAPGPVPVSVEAEMVRALNLELGDRLVFNVQGFPIETVVGSIREVDWNSLRPNFLVVFPTGVLEAAPTFYVTATRVESPEALGALQREVVALHSNVVAIDLERALQSIGEILDRVAFVIRFMAGFTGLTGLVILVISLTTSRYQRIRESILLRTLGASGGQVRRILAVEYFLTGFLSGLAGLGLAVVAAGLLVHYAFEVSLVVPVPELLGVFIGFGVFTTLVGLLNSRGIATQPPLEVLRRDG